MFVEKAKICLQSLFKVQNECFQTALLLSYTRFLSYLFALPCFCGARFVSLNYRSMWICHLWAVVHHRNEFSFVNKIYANSFSKILLVSIMPMLLSSTFLAICLASSSECNANEPH